MPYVAFEPSSAGLVSSTLTMGVSKVMVAVSDWTCAGSKKMYQLLMPATVFSSMKKTWFDVSTKPAPTAAAPLYSLKL